jgi:flagellar motility protein MotE (MotC chaperone)
MMENERQRGEPTADSAPAVSGTSPAARPDDARAPLFGARRRVKELAGEVAELRTQLDRVGGLTLLEIERHRLEVAKELEDQRIRLERERAEAVSALAAEMAEAEANKKRLLGELEALRADVVETRDVALLQEAGIYEYRHPLASAVSYQAKLREIRDRVKTMVRAEGGAVLHSTEWTVNGSAAQGRKMVREYSKLMLRAYNAEADNLVRGLKPYKLEAAIERLNRVAETIRRLGATMGIGISGEYQALRVYELEVTADYVAKLAEEKEREREEREQLREERRAQQEIERERARLEKERQHYLNALQALRANGNETALEGLQAELAEINRAIEQVDYRAANIRAGYVYVISNIGSFGESLIKIGMTRRLEPADRIRELGDASVPFRYDTHALFFSDDAVGIEAALHQRLADRRVNRVNTRREFFYATPNEVKQHLLELTGALLSYEEMPEALEFRQSQNIANATNSIQGDPDVGRPDLLEAITPPADAPEDADETPASTAEPSFELTN